MHFTRKAPNSSRIHNLYHNNKTYKTNNNGKCNTRILYQVLISSNSFSLNNNNNLFNNHNFNIINSNNNWYLNNNHILHLFKWILNFPKCNLIINYHNSFLHRLVKSPFKKLSSNKNVQISIMVFVLKDLNVHTSM